MKRFFQEQRHTLSYLLFWTAMASCVGVLTGVGVWLFLSLLEELITINNQWEWSIFFLPMVLAATRILSRHLWPEDRIETTNEVIRVVLEHTVIRWKSVLKAFFLPILTIGFGGSAGKEAPAADIGAGMASLFGQLLGIRGGMITANW